jgi:hypothetical protein
VKNGSDALDLGWIAGLIKRVASPSEVMVPEHDVYAVRGGERTESATKLRCPSRPADQVTCDGD